MALNFQRGQLAPFLRKPMGMIGQSATMGGYGGGTFGMDGQQMDTQQPMPQEAQAAPSPGGKLDWRNILGAIGDGMQAFGGGQGTYAPAMQAQREQMADEQRVREQIQAQARQREQDRVARMEDWQTQQAWQRENPAPTAQDRNFQNYQHMTPEQRKEFAAYQALVKPQFVSGFDGQYQVQQGGSGLPEGYDPSEWDIVDEEGGAGPGQPGFR